MYFVVMSKTQQKPGVYLNMFGKDS